MTEQATYGRSLESVEVGGQRCLNAGKGCEVNGITVH